MKILIAGAGIGGLALAALLRQRGIVPELVDRAPNFNHAGYMLGLYPLGSRVLIGLGLRDRFLESSARYTTYTICNGHGEPIHEYDLSGALAHFGYSGGLMRGELLEMLRSKCEDVPLTFNRALTGFEDRGEKVAVQFSDGTTGDYDVVIGADGIHSKTRRQLLGDVPEHETGWGCWVWMMPRGTRSPDAVTEYWGTSRLLGVYPVRNALGIVAAAPSRHIAPEIVGKDGRQVREFFAPIGDKVADVLAALPDSTENLFYWRLNDVRSTTWCKGRVALLGDAACAFLPTAGVGASMALESAAVMADELSRTDAVYAPRALELYAKRRQRRAEHAQDDSRHLASMMTIERLPLAWGRDQLLKLYTLEMLVKNIAKSLAEPI